MSEAVIPLMITNQMRANLTAAGFSNEQIKIMTPAEAWEALGGMPTDQAKDNLNLRAALTLAMRGWHVFPCALDKRPVETGGANPQTGEPYRLQWGKFATCDPDQVKALWHKYPNAPLIGIFCKKSGIFAVDIDVKNGLDGWRSLTELVKTYGAGADIACGPIQQTPSGGAHLIFRYPEGLKIPNNAGRLASGLDLRSDGYICTGGAYMWMVEHGPESTLTDAPIWLLDLIRNQTKKPATPATIPDSQPTPNASAYWLRYYLSRAGIGNRNDCGFYLACQLRDSGLGEAEARGIMQDYAAHVPNGGSDPYTEGAALASLKSAYNAPRREAAHLPGIVHHDEHGATSNTTPGPEPDQTKPVGPILLTELGNSRRFASAYRNQVVHVKAWGWLVWTGKRWESDETGRSVSLAKQIVDNLFNEAQSKLDEAQRLAAILAKSTVGPEQDSIKAKYDAVLDMANKLLRWAMQSQTAQKITAILSLAESDLAARVSDFDSDSWLLNVQNGVINLRTGELQPHDPNQRITKLASTFYNPLETCPTWLRFLNRVFNNDQELISFIQRAVGYSLTGDTSEQCFFFLFGSGRNGKSTFTNAIAALLGDYYRKTQSSNLMIKQNSGAPTDGIAALVGARFVSASELARGQKLNEEIVKDLTGGGDMIPARKLYRDEFTFKPVLKLWMYGNEKPQIRETNEAIWRRVRLIPFTVTIPENEVDPFLPDKLLIELPGILAWAVQGCLEWQRQRLGTAKAIKLATDEYRQEEDVIAQFLAECCILEPKAEASISDLHTAFTRWGGGWSAKALSQELQRRGFNYKRTSKGRGFIGIGLPTPETQPEINF